MRFNTTCLGFLICFSFGAAIADSTTDIDRLDWLGGKWIGEGQEGDDGEVKGVARLYWTPPLEGSISYFFTWHVAETEHVHYAVTVFQLTQFGVVGKGIHYGPAFNTFEDQPWHLVVDRIGDGVVEFQCVEFCTADSVSFTLLEDGVMEERWRPKPDLEEDKPDWIVRYRRDD